MAIKINNMNELIKDFKTRINGGDKTAIDSLKSENGIGFSKINKDVLKTAAEALKFYLQKWILNYYNSYYPSVYPRTGQFYDSLLVNVTSIDGKLTAKVYFDDNKVIRDSIWTDKNPNQPKGYLPALLNDGWKVTKGGHKDIHRFGFFEGTHFIEAAIKDAENDPKFKNIHIIPPTKFKDNPFK